ncbi:MAG TPA: tetratricopeptide repeat protein [Candidatus Saccharimonadales bacterium]|nr:tetratricopeptide repeat protein [Candidatus Saccharimonadales bacterium]
MKNPFLLSASLAAALLAAPPAPVRAQTAGDADLAHRTFLNAEHLLQEGKTEQAMKDYQQVVQAFPDSAWADDALMRLGSNQYPAESLSGLAKAGLAAQDAARPFFEQVRERYPESDSAPAALYKLGLLSLEPRSPRRNLDEAYASFSRVVNIYPGSDWVGPAHVGAAFAEMGKASYDHAVLSLERGLQEMPRGAAAAEAHYLLGVCNARMGDPVRSAESFQQSRLDNPGGPLAGRALDWLTLLYRLRILTKAGKTPHYERSVAFVPAPPPGTDLRGDVRIAVSPTGELAVADPKEGRVLTFRSSGQLADNTPFTDPILVAFDAFGGLMTVGRGHIAADGKDQPLAKQDGSKTRPVEKIGGAWRAAGKGIWILDTGDGELLLYGADLSQPKVLVTDKAAGVRMSALAAGPDDLIYVLDEKSDGVLVLQDGGLDPLTRGGATAGFEDPVALATDALGDIYVLDAKRKVVEILGPDGGHLATIAPPAGSPAEMEGPASLAVGPGGEVYVYDERKRTILLYD